METFVYSVWVNFVREKIAKPEWISFISQVAAPQLLNHPLFRLLNFFRSFPNNQHLASRKIYPQLFWPHNILLSVGNTVGQHFLVVNVNEVGMLGSFTLKLKDQGHSFGGAI